MNGQASSQPQQAQLQIDFLVVGGGIAGLACAIALRRVGHRVLVLEKDDGSTQPSGACRGPPNMSKILFHWGLGDKLRKISLVSEAIQIQLYGSGDMLGAHKWDEEVLKETRGVFVFMHHADLRRLLKDTAISYGAKIRHNAEVASIDSDGRSVTLLSGEVIRADVIVGADGPSSIARKMILEEDDREEDVGSPSGFVMYNTLVPKKLMMQDPDLAHFYNQRYTNLFAWCGNGRNVVGFPIGGTADFALVVNTPDDAEDGAWLDHLPRKKLLQVLTEIPCEPRLQKLAKLAAPPARLPVRHYEELEDWVHSSGRLLVIGEAAHPIPPASIQSAAMAIEDGAVLAKLFSHLRNEDQIPSFLWAFQDLRQKRCSSVIQGEMGNLYFMAMPPGEQQAARDADMREKHAAGRNVLDPGEGGGNDQWEQCKELFGYDAEDEADNWWVEWGILRERAKMGSSLDFGMNVQVEQAVH